MRVLLVHTRYRLRGGEDECFEAEQALLRRLGVEVDVYEDDNRRLDEVHPMEAGRTTVWSHEAYEGILAKLKRAPADVVHVHNYLPLISPAAYHAAHEAGAAVVQTLHNYRLICANGLFFRDGRICEDCLGKAVPWPSVVHSCYRDSPAGSFAIASMLTYHRRIGTFENKVDLYVALNDFMRRKYIEGGFPADKICVKPNFVSHDPGMGEGDGDFAIFVARLAGEKGVRHVLEAWQDLGPLLPLKIVGEGPLGEDVRMAAERTEGVESLGRLPLADVYALMRRARLAIVSSTWYEGFPRTITESLAHGLPIVASAIGPLPELVVDGETGVLFRPGDSADLVAKVRGLLDQPDRLNAMRLRARAEYLDKYTATINGRLLFDAYARAIAVRHGRAKAA